MTGVQTCALPIWNFVSKLTDADGENGETEIWLDFASHCEYLSESRHRILTEKCREVGATLGDPDKRGDLFHFEIV